MAAMTSRDPRSASDESLVPDPASEDTYRRKLLLVYVHGFMGDETSFRSFPAHVHNVVTITLADSHSVHTKIYPKYRPRYALEVARDDFSNWLAPHETPWTDVILLGHSMGGLLASDIALVFRHNIIGVINFDVPFLGMHPGIIKTGLASIFNPAPAPTDAPVSTPEERPGRVGTMFNPKPADPNFNPSFYNDVHLPVRKGWESALHWMNKHSNGIVNAGKGLVRSHIEFGGSMADYKELKDRYARIRALEEDNPGKRRAANPEGQTPPRIRFLNYYTASTGRPKKPKSPRCASPSRPSSQDAESRHESTVGAPKSHDQSTASIAGNQHASSASSPSGSRLDLTHVHPEPLADISPKISVEEHRAEQVVPATPQDPLSATTPSTEHHQATQPSEPELPEIPPIPQEPAFVDLAQYPDKAERRAAEKEHSRALQEYQKAVKARNKVIKERSKMQEKWQKQKDKEAAAALKEAKEKQGQSTPAHHDSASTPLSPPPTPSIHTPSPALEPRPSISDTATLSSEFSSMNLGTIDSHATSHPPYNTYDFSHSAIMSAPTPSDRTSLAESSAYTDSTYAPSPTTSPHEPHRPTSPHHPASATAAPPPTKPKKLKKFCMLPPKDANGNSDPAWVCVHMQGMDAVTAHTSLFFMSERYEMLVGDVAGRVEEWVRECESERLVREMGG